MNKKIGIIDLNVGAVSIINSLYKTFKNYDIVYVNDMAVATYELMEIEKIQERIQKNIDFLVSLNVELIIVANDSLIEYGSELFKGLNKPVINIVDTIIEYVNEHYEYKNFGFMACSEIIEANIYQKNIRYNHLYNLPADQMANLLTNGIVKTTESFEAVKNTIIPIYKKDVDLIIPTMINFSLLKIEICEYIRNVEILDVTKLLVEEAVKILKPDNEKKKNTNKIYIYVNKDTTKNYFDKFLEYKYKVVKL